MHPYFISTSLKTKLADLILFVVSVKQLAEIFDVSFFVKSILNFHLFSIWHSVVVCWHSVVVCLHSVVACRHSVVVCRCSGGTINRRIDWVDLL